MPPTAKDFRAGPTGPIPKWSAKGCLGVPPNSATQTREYYSPANGMFKTEFTQFEEFEKAFKQVSAAAKNVATKNEYDAALLGVYTDRRDVLVSAYLRQTDLGITLDGVIADKTKNVRTRQQVTS